MPNITKNHAITYTYLYFTDFSRVWKIAGQISRLFQEFKTQYKPCLLFLTMAVI